MDDKSNKSSPTHNSIKWVKGYKGLADAYVKIKVPSISAIVSQIPDPELDAWIKEVGQEKADEIGKKAAQRGTAMHAFIENFLGELKISHDPTKALKVTQDKTPKLLKEENIPEYKIDEGRKLFYSYYYSDYCNSSFKVLGLEFPIHSPTYYFRGIIDLLYNQNLHGVSVTDFKTSSSYIKENSTKNKKYKTQLGGYSVGVEDMYKTKGKNLVINYASIISVNTKRESVQLIECQDDELNEYKEYFKTLVKEWHINNKPQITLS